MLKFDFKQNKKGKLMKKVKLLLLPLVLTNIATATMYENAEDGSTERWSVYDQSPSGATIINETDATQGNVITFSGDALNNGYKLNFSPKNTTQKTLEWDMKYNEDIIIYVRVVGKNAGPKLLLYKNAPQSSSQLGLGANASNGEWQHFTRNLEEDLRFKMNDPDEELQSVKYFQIRGSGSIDNIELTGNTVPVPVPNWSVYDKNPEGATITQIDDPLGEEGKVIALQGEGKKNGYMLGFWGATGLNWTNISWKMNYTEPFSVYIVVETEDGNRYLWYSSKNIVIQPTSTRYIRHAVGTNVLDGEWHNFTRDLESDLQARPETENLHVLNVKAIMVRGSGLITDIVDF